MGLHLRKNLNIHDKSASMSSDYDMNEHIHGLKYQYQYPIDGQVSSRGSIRHKAQFDQCKIHLRVRVMCYNRTTILCTRFKLARSNVGIK